VTTRSTEQPHPFITHLEGLQDDRGALAALRRGLGRPAGHAPTMFPYVVPFVPPKASEWQEEAYYLIAALFGFYPVSTRIGNMGSHFAQLRRQKNDGQAVERRFIALLAAHPDDLNIHLRQAVGLLRSGEVPVNWSQLLRDTLSWNNPDWRADVHRRWATAFWGGPQTATSEAPARPAIES